MSRKEEKGMTSIEDSVDGSERGRDDYIKKNKQKLITASSNSIQGKNKQNKTRKREENNCIDISNILTRLFTRRPVHGYEREAKSFLIAALNYAIMTNYIKARIDNMQQNSKCRLCRDQR